MRLHTSFGSAQHLKEFAKQSQLTFLRDSGIIEMQGQMRRVGVREVNAQGSSVVAGAITDLASDKIRFSVSVIIPTLNEAGNLPYVLNTVPDWVDEIVIVDGRSSDDTERVARVLEPDIRIVNQTRRGKGAALRAGLDAAKGDFLIVMDADGSMDGSDLGSFRDALLAGADYVKGSRFLPGAGSIDITKLRRFGDWGICLLMRALFGTRYSDGTFGFKALRADCLKLIPIDTDGFEVELLIDIRAHRAGLVTVEVACFETHRIHGNSNLNAFRDGLRCFRVIVRERFRRYRVPTI